MRVLLGILGFSVLITAGIAALLVLVVLGLLVAPALVAVAWNLLDFGQAIGLGPLGFWSCVLLGWFLAAPMALRLVIVVIVFIADPAWLGDSATVHWPEPTLRNLAAVVILLLVASFGHGHSGGERRRRQPVESTAGSPRNAP